MKTKPNLLKFMTIAPLIFFFLGISPFPDRCMAEQRYQMSAASMGGGMYRWCAAFSKILNEELKDKNVQFTVRTGSPRANILMLEEGEVPLASSGPTYSLMVHPEDRDFSKTRIRTIWPMLSFCRFIVVPEDSPHKTINDLKGKKIAVGIKTGEGGDFVTLVKYSGWTEEDMKGFYFVGKNEGIAAYKDRTVDAWHGGSVIPSPHFMQLAASRRGARLLPLSDKLIADICNNDPSYVPGVIPAGMHENVKVDVPTVYVWMFLLARDDFPEDIAYEMVKAADKRLDDIVAVFKAAHVANKENAAKLAKFPLYKMHPGVARFLKEQGLM